MMGLDATHDAFSGAYSAFNRFRQMVAKAAGGSFPPHDIPLHIGGEVYEKPDQERFYIPGKWEQYQIDKPGLSAFLISNDCEGSFPPELCKHMADELEVLIPEVEKMDAGDWGHIGRDGGYVAVLKRYIAGCRAAYEAGETMEYR